MEEKSQEISLTLDNTIQEFAEFNLQLTKDLNERIVEADVIREVRENIQFLKQVCASTTMTATTLKTARLGSKFSEHQAVQDSNPREDVIMDVLRYQDLSCFMVYTRTVIQKPPDEFLNLQNEASQDNFDKFLLDITKIIAREIKKYLAKPEQHEVIIFDETIYCKIEGFMVYAKIVIQKMPDGLAKDTGVIPNYSQVAKPNNGCFMTWAINNYLSKLVVYPASKQSIKL